MNRFAALFLLALGGWVVLAGCGAREDSPSKVINQDITAQIERAGGDPEDWVFENGCALNGACTATLSLAARPERILAGNSYVARDSRAFLKGPDRIGAAIENAYVDGCLIMSGICREYDPPTAEPTEKERR